MVPNERSDVRVLLNCRGDLLDFAERCGIRSRLPDNARGGAGWSTEEVLWDMTMRLLEAIALMESDLSGYIFEWKSVARRMATTLDQLEPKGLLGENLQRFQDFRRYA